MCVNFIYDVLSKPGILSEKTKNQIIEWNKSDSELYNYFKNKLFDKIKSFGWNLITINGHDPLAIHAAANDWSVYPFERGGNKPTCIILDNREILIFKYNSIGIL